MGRFKATLRRNAVQEIEIMLRIALLALALAGCASAPSSPEAKSRTRADRVNERNQEALRNMRDEFNALTRDAN